MTAHEKPEERGGREAASDSSMPCTNPNCAIVLQLAWYEIERLRNELEQLRAELDRVRIGSAHGRAVTEPP
jgi:hypothetical protein